MTHAAPSAMPQLVLLRHGETAWSRAGRHTGRTDIPLTAAGEQRAHAAGRVLARRRSSGRDFDLVLCSPLVRARTTARLAGFPDAIADADLMEWDYGPVEGLTTAQVSAALGRPWQIFRDGVNVRLNRGADTGTAPGTDFVVDCRGEELAAVAGRAAAAMGRVLPVLEAGGDVLMVAHGHFLRIFAAVWLGLEAVFAERLELGTAAMSTLGNVRGLRTLDVWNVSAPAP